MPEGAEYINILMGSKEIAYQTEVNMTAKKLFEDVLKKKNPKIKLLGDSITHGVGGSGWAQNGELIVPGWSMSPDSFCWANTFRDHMKEKYGATVVNKACTGTRVEFIIEHFDTLVDRDDDLIVCMIGTNNRHQNMSSGEKKSRETMLYNFYENVKRLYAMLKETEIPVIFMANIPASKKNEQDGADYWRILHMNDINDTYKKFAREERATVFSLYDAFSAYCEENGIDYETLLCDGLHPNDEGYRVMFALISEAFGV